MTRLGSFLRRLGMCILCGAIVVSMIGCNVDGDADSNWTQPSTTARPVENYVTKDYMEKYIADQFTGCEYATIKKVLVDNAVAFGAWNDNTKILSTEDNHVTFTCNEDGNFGISKKLAVDISLPVIIQFKAEFDSNLFGVHINAFDGNGSFLTAWRVDKGTKQYELPHLKRRKSC